MHQKLPLLMEVAIEPKEATGTDALAAALQQLTANSMRLDLTTDRESGQTILCGTSEAELEKACAKLDEMGVKFNVGAPQIAYRETISRPITIEYAHKKILSGGGEFALVRILFEPIHDGSELHDIPSIMFENRVEDSIPAEFAAAVEKGIRTQAKSGLKAGFPVTAFYATLVRAAYHEVDSSERTFDIAARTAFRELANQDVMQIAEPYMRIEVATPEDFLGGIIGDLNSRRGTILGTTSGELYQLVAAIVPLANMFGYQRTLDSMSQGRATYEMQFHHYVPVPDPPGGDDNFPGAMGMRVA
jgi:elongation factor G